MRLNTKKDSINLIISIPPNYYWPYMIGHYPSNVYSPRDGTPTKQLSQNIELDPRFDIFLSVTCVSSIKMSQLNTLFKNTRVQLLVKFAIRYTDNIWVI